MDDIERAKVEAENLIDILQDEKSSLEESKSKIFHVSYQRNCYLSLYII